MGRNKQNDNPHFPGLGPGIAPTTVVQCVLAASDTSTLDPNSAWFRQSQNRSWLRRDPRPSLWGGGRGAHPVGPVGVPLPGARFYAIWLRLSYRNESQYIVSGRRFEGSWVVDWLKRETRENVCKVNLVYTMVQEGPTKPKPSVVSGFRRLRPSCSPSLSPRPSLPRVSLLFGVPPSGATRILVGFHYIFEALLWDVRIWSVYWRPWHLP